jgi:tetratricopeptide (TPR) repeat protein
VEGGRYAEARAAAEAALAASPPEPDVLVLAARACNGLGDFEAGALHARAAIERAPDSSEAHYRLAEALRIKMTRVSRVKALLVVGSYKEALARAIDLDPGNVVAREEEIGFLINAPAAVGGSDRRAVERIAQLRALDPRRAALAQASRLVVQDDPAGALAVLEEAGRRWPDDFEVQHALAERLIAAGRYAEAERHLAPLAASTHPVRAARVLYSRSLLRIRAPFELERAAGYLREFLSRVPSDLPELPPRAAAWHELGLAHEQLGQRGPAREAYRRSLDLDPDRREARAGFERLGG